MSRAYRPRLSKDKAVAQRVGEELERERLQDFSVARQMAALGVGSPHRNTPYASSQMANADLSWSPGGSQRRSSTRRSSTPSTSSREGWLQRSAGRSVTTATGTAHDPIISTDRAAQLTNVQTRSPKRKRSRPYRVSDAGSADAARDNGWACLSCSFLNTELTQKCRMCGTKNFHPRAQRAEVLVGEPDQEPLMLGEGSRDHGSRRRGAKRFGANSTECDTSINGTSSGEASANSACTARKTKAAASGGVDDIRLSNRRRKLGTAMDPAAAERAVEGSTSVRRLKNQGRRTLEAEIRTRVNYEHHENDSGLLASPSPEKRVHGRTRVPGLVDVSSSTVTAELPSNLSFGDCVFDASLLREGGGLTGPDCTNVSSSRLLHGVKGEEERSTLVSREEATIEVNRRRLPTIVTPLTHERDEQNDKQGNPCESSSVSPDQPSPRLTATPPSERAPCDKHQWPKIALAARLDFSGRSVWEVSHVVVKQSSLHQPGGKKDRRGRGATVVVCHSGGVSVWALTDLHAVCTHLSPVLAGVAKEQVRGCFYVAAVASGAEVAKTPSAAGTRESVQTCIVAIGRHVTDPGLPIIRVWQGPLWVAEGPQGKVAADKKGVVLKTILKKKFSTFFPPAAARDVLPCLCVCGSSSAVESEDEGCRPRDDANPGEITCVMALGVKAVRIVCALWKSRPGDVRAKGLPTGAVDVQAVFTSLAAVPDNPFLVWASLPSSNVLLLWDVQELRLLFTLPLTASSICVPAISLPSPLTARGHDLAWRSALRTPVPGGVPRRRDPTILCVLATEGILRGGTARSRSERGCDLYGVCVDFDEDAGAQGASISAVRLEEGGGASLAPSRGRSLERSLGVLHDSAMGVDTCLSSLSDGNGFVAGVDKAGNVVARSVLSGESRVLVAAAETPNGHGVASVACDRGAGFLAVTTTGGMGGIGANTVDLYTFERY